MSAAGSRIGPQPVRDPLTDAYENRPTAPEYGGSLRRSTTMLGQLHSELARQKHREDSIAARRIRLVRAARAERRARRALEIAVRAGERVHAETVNAPA